METKDLVLLMLIPIILVSLVVYIDKTPAITGAVTAQQEKNNILGTYSVNPSFKAKINYNLEQEYKNIKETLNKIINECINHQNIEQCFELKSNEFNWNCQEKDEAVKVLYDFVDKFNECMNLKEDGVVCRFSLDEREIMNRIFNIRLTTENQKIKAELMEFANLLETAYLNQENILYTDYNNKDAVGKSADIVNIVVKYLSKKPNVISASAKIDLSRIFLLYKAKDGVKFIDVAEEKSFLAPDPEGKIGLPKIIDLPKTRGFKFCANTGKEFYVYDKSANTVKLRDIVYKFAVTYPNPPTPPPIQFLTAADKEKAEKSIILRWNKAKWEDGSDVDLDHYNIYCSKSPLQDKNTKEIKLDDLKPTMAVKADTNYDSWIVDVNKCEKDDIQDGVDYYFAVTAVSQASKESKAIMQAFAKSIDDLAPGVQKIVLINSANVREEKTSSACINLPIEKDNKAGNIWVGFFQPEKNEDGVTNIRLDEQLTYFLHYSKQNPVINNLDICDTRGYKCVELDFAPQDKIDYAPKRTFHKNKEIDNPNTIFVEGQTYCFTIIAKDKNNNIIKNLPYKFVKPQQWLDLEAKPVKKGFLDDKGEIVYT